MSTLYRRCDSKFFWYKERIPGRQKPLYVGLRIEDKRLARLRQQQLDRILTEIRLPQLDWTFVPELERDAQLREIVAQVCADLGITLAFRSNVTIEEALASYEAHCVARKAPKSHKSDWPRLTGFFKWANCTYLHEIRSSQIQDYLVYRLKHDGIAKKTANLTLQSVKGFYNFCLKRDLVRSNPANRVETFKCPVIPQHYLKEPSDISRLLQTAKRMDSELFPMVVAGISTGCRLGELFALEWPDVDFAERKILIQDKPHLGLRTKSGKFRTIPLSPALAAVLLPLRRDRGFVFLPHRMERKYTSPLFRRWREICAAAGMPQTTWYSLRRTFCSQLAMHGTSLLKIQVWAGHSDPRMTKDHYAHLAPEYDPEIERVLEDGYKMVTIEGPAKKEESRYLLPDNGLASTYNTRGRRGSNPQPTDRQSATLTD